MNKNIITCLIACLFSASITSAQSKLKESGAVKGVVRVKLQPTLVKTLPKTEAITANEKGKPLQIGIKPLDLTLQKIGGKKMRKVFPCSPEREAEHAKYGLDQWYEIVYDDDMTPSEARGILKNTPGVENAAVKVPMKLYGDGPYRVVESPVANKAAASNMPFNDPQLPQQWHYHNDGSMNGAVPGADINLFKAWETSTGSSKVVVAIIDGGFDTNHEDLAANTWINEAELNGKAGVDDDGNGYIDDINGYNFCTNNGRIYPHSHGTHVAGTVSAVNNNGIGVCGVAGGNGTEGSGVKMMSCQVFDSREGSGSGDFAAAIIYAADMGATIAQCSWGWGLEGYYEQDVLDAIKYFTHSARSNNMTGGICIFAAGNDGKDGDFYPNCMDEVLTVASMTYSMQPAPYSCFGKWVDITAPGGWTDYDAKQGVLSTLPSNSYGFNEGTSMAAPHVSGIAALILSKYGSPNLTNENLRQQLLTSVNDFYTLNPKAEGLFGSGYVDANKALQWGDGTAPSAVSNISATAMQESIALQWTIPTSTAGNVHNHILYYSTSPFTDGNLSSCKTIVIDTKFCNPGDEFQYEITGLSPMTPYYIALRAIDRWGNASPISPVITVTTNAGPKMTISRTSMALNCSDGTTWPTRTFNIGNDDDGLLKWSIKTRTALSGIRHYDNQSTKLMTVPYSGKAVIQPCAASSSSEIVKDLADFSQDDYPKDICNFTEVYAYIGDNELPNSMAQQFTVDKEKFPNGFNLTHVNISGYYGKHPIIEVYRNTGLISSASLLERYDAGEDAIVYSYDHALPEALFFNPGESFYIVVHFEGYDTRNYPLGLGIGNGSQDAAHAYMSNDKGKTWSLLSEVLQSTSYAALKDKGTWCIKAISKFPDWSEVLTITPSQGTLKKGETQAVTVTSNGTPIPNGSYRALIQFDTNETQHDPHTITVSINVEGQTPDVTYNKVVDFGNILVGQEKTVTVQVFNKGYGAFAGGDTYPGIFKANITSSSPHFRGPDYMQDGIPARATANIQLTYAPTEPGNHSGVVTLYDKDGRQLRINLNGSATAPAKIDVNPQTISVGDLNADGATKNVSFTITNSGQYPLQFVMPKFSNETFDDLPNSSSTHRFGYVWQSNMYGSQDILYEGAPQLIDPVDVTSQFGDYDYFSDPIEIGFKFPFYGKTYDKVYISSLGTLSFDSYTQGNIYSPIYPSVGYINRLGVISAYGFEFKFSPTSKVQYARQDGKFIVNFKDVLVAVYEYETIPASFHIALSPSGEIDIAFDDYTAEKVFQQGSPIWVGIVDPEQEDPLSVTSSEVVSQAYWYDDKSEPNNRWRYINTGTQFKFYAPKPNMISSISPSHGIIATGETMTINAVVAANDEMYEGETYTDLVIQSNDITTPTKIVRFNANIVGDLKPLFELSSDKIDFGEVLRTSVARQSVTVQNNGRATMTLKGVSIKNGRFTHNFTEEVAIPAGQSKDIVVTLPTENEGEVTDMMTITTSEGEKTIPINGKVIGAPDVAFGYNLLNETLASGESKQIPLNITNTGNEPLQYSIVAGSHLSYTPEYKEGADTEYTYVSSLDDPSTFRDWIDIETNGLSTQYNYTYFLKQDIVDVELPFAFPFFGKNYDKLYVYDAGFVSFTERKDEGGIWPEPPSNFPEGCLYTNMIAPFWGLHTMDITHTAGIFTYADEEKAVISFIEYGNTMNIGIDFQVVLRKDGTFTFNYKPAYDNAVLFGAFGLSGYVREDGTGLKLPLRYIELNSSLTFSPIVTNILRPGQSSQAEISLNADDLAGNYSSKITVNTNVPTKPTIDIPVNLTITGTAAPVLPDDIIVENVSEYLDNNRSDELIGMLGAYWYIPLQVSNSGTAPYTITGIDVETPVKNGNNLFNLYWYGTYTDSWSGAQTTGWNPYSGKSINVRRSAIKFAIPLWSNDYSHQAWDTPGEYKIKLTFHISGVEGMTEKTVNVTCRITEQPKFELDKEEIRVKAPSDYYTAIETVTISNANGKYPLRYTVTVDPTGVGASDTSSPIAPMQAQPQESDIVMSADTYQLQPFDVGRSDFAYNAPDEDQHFDYSRALYWPALESSTMAWNYGTTTTYGTYKAATAFEGPEGGFNISHIYFALHPYNLNNKDVEIDIVNGDPQVSTDIIGHGTYHVGASSTELYQNVKVVAALDRPVYISQGQKFYVVITFPPGQEYPATLIKKQHELVSNRYLGYWDNYGWFDVATLFMQNYGSLGYMLSCLETTEGDAWIKVLDPTTGEPSSAISGEIPAGDSSQLKVRISAAEAPKALDNKAILIINTNDPNNTLTNFPVYLDKNAAPAITVSASNLLVNEDEEITFTATAVDPENEDFTFYVSDEISCATVQAAEALLTGDHKPHIPISFDKKSVAVRNVAGGIKVTIKLAPAFMTAGVHTLTFKAVDKTGHTSTVPVNFTVGHVNHAPLAKPFNNIMIQTGTMSDMFDLATMFDDPDDVVLTYNISISDNEVANIFRSDNLFFFRGLKQGEAEVTATCTDPSNEVATNKFKLIVADDPTAISTISDSSIKIAIDANTLNITTGDNTGEVKVSVFSTSGVKVAAANYKASPLSQSHTMNVSALPAGNYIVSVTVGEESLTKTIVKK